MLSNLKHNSWFTSVNAMPIVLCWMVGIALGLSYLAMPDYLFWVALAILLISAVIYHNFRYGYYLALLIMPVDMTQLSITLPEMSSYRIIYVPYFVPLCITLIAWVFSGLRKQEPRDRTTPINGLMLFMVVYMLTSLLWAPHINTGLYLAFSLVVNFSIFLLARDVIVDEAELRRAAIVWLVMGLMTATGVILSQWYAYKHVWHVSSSIVFVINFGKMMSRPSGFGSVNNMAGLLSISIFITFGLFMITKKNIGKAFLVVLMCYQLVAMVLTASRGALFGFIAGLVLLFLIHPAIRSKVLKYSVLSLVLVAIVIFAAKPAYIDRILVGFGYSGELYFTEMTSDNGATTMSSNDAEQKTGMSWRISHWKKGLKEMQNHWYKMLLGLGIGGFITYADIIYTHSVPFSFFFDLGLLGILVFIVLTIILVTNFRRYINEAKRTDSYYIFLCLIVAFVAEVCIHGLIDYDFYSYPARMFWLPLSFVCAGLNVMMAENPDLWSK